MRDRSGASPTAPNTPSETSGTTRLADLDAAAYRAASYVKPSTLATRPDEPLSAKGLAALAKLESALAWELR